MRELDVVTVAADAGLRKMILNVARLLHKTTKGSFCIWATCVKQDAELLGRCIRINPLANRTGRISRSTWQPTG